MRGTRGYIERFCHQINRSYENGRYDGRRGLRPSTGDFFFLGVLLAPRSVEPPRTWGATRSRRCPASSSSVIDPPTAVRITLLARTLIVSSVTWEPYAKRSFTFLRRSRRPTIRCSAPLHSGLPPAVSRPLIGSVGRLYSRHRCTVKSLFDICIICDTPSAWGETRPNPYCMLLSIKRMPATNRCENGSRV